MTKEINISYLKMIWNSTQRLEDRLISERKNVHSIAENAREAYVLAQAAEVSHTEGEERPLLDGELIHMGDEHQCIRSGDEGQVLQENWVVFDKSVLNTPWQKFLPIVVATGKEWIILNSRTKRPLPKAIADPYNLSCFGPRRY